MDVRDIIQSEKRIKSVGSWTMGTMPRTAFPLSKSGSKAYRLGNRRWRLVTFEAEGLSCRLLVNYSYALSQYQAMMGVDHNGDTKVLAFLERHPTHKGWHAHACCDPIQLVPAGIKRGSWMKNLDGSGVKHQAPIPNSDAAAFARAVSFFRLDKTIEGGGLL